MQTIHLDPHHRHECRTRRDAERLQARADHDVRAAQVKRLGKKGNTDRCRIDKIQALIERYVEVDRLLGKL